VVTIGLRIRCLNWTRGGSTWAWSFGDGSTSDARNPSHTYDAPGTYTITLVATSRAGGVDTVSRQVTVPD
jgi:PKD repeat protein